MAKFQHRQLWAITMMAGFIGLIAWCLDFQFLDYISQPLACASIAYTAAYQFLKDARKMLTHRMRCYSELAAYRAFHAKKTTELEQSTTTKKTASPE